MIDLYYWPTPNGKKVAILLEETQLPYRVVPVDIGKGDQFTESYLALNPNHRMPVIVDREPLGGGKPISVFESGAILMYIAEKAGRFWPQTPREKYEVAQWVFWQMANQGPKFGESGHFRRAAQKPENGDLKYPLRRFDDEVNRLLGVMNNRLYDRRYLGGNDYSIADIVSYPWSLNWQTLGQNIDEFKHVKRWLADVGGRPAVRRGMEVGKELAVDFSKLSKEELDRRMKILSNQRALPAPG
ncbi:MAG TPA: glutathione S-transferase N-terminal domain-containing protein [Gammaproteobacteria bacterium]|nr:glutathione S-transferase N-terminal domain-containing protein [Gammaproteobacteria bacterium]